MPERRDMVDSHDRKRLSYGRQIIDAADAEAVTAALFSDWLTTGPRVEEFEKAWAGFCHARESVAVANGTVALHAAVAALGIGPGDSVIVTPMTFAASVNCVLYAGAEPLFADVDPETLLMDPSSVAKVVAQNRGKRIQAIIPVDYAGHPCDYDAIRAASPGIPVIADACHSPGATYRDRPVGTLGDLNCFSFHPVKHLTTGEGGAVTTDNAGLAKKMREFRNHGIDSDHRQRAEKGVWAYDMKSLGCNYRLTDIQCALGLSQLGKLPNWIAKRRELANLYRSLLATVPGVEPLGIAPWANPSWHLFVVRIRPEFTLGRDDVFVRLREKNIEVNVHYPPVHLFTYYRERFGFGPGLCPAAEQAAGEILTLPLWAGMEDADVLRVVQALRKMKETP